MSAVHAIGTDLATIMLELGRRARTAANYAARRSTARHLLSMILDSAVSTHAAKKSRPSDEYIGVLPGFFLRSSGLTRPKHKCTYREGGGLGLLCAGVLAPRGKRFLTRMPFA